MEYTGIVVKTTGSWHYIKTEDKLLPCKAAGKLRMKGIKATNPVTVGDKVLYRISDSGENGTITKIFSRDNYIIRKAIKLSKQHHLIAANIDQSVLVVSTKQPETPYEFIDRFLLTSEAYFIPTIIIFNKNDIIQNTSESQKLEQYIETYKNIGYRCEKVSAATGYNIPILRDILKDKRSLISGNSGVGKSSLINTVDENISQKTGEISAVHDTGKHVTTYSEMFTLSFGGEIIDTPGIRGFGIIDMKQNETGLYFIEIFKYSKHCKYNNCTHTHEPGCAVKNAVSDGEIAPSRYNSYLNVFLDDKEKYR